MNKTAAKSSVRTTGFDIASDQVVVWRVALAPSPERVGRLRSLLSTDEIARADRFFFQKHRDRFTIARGALRSILGACADADPRAIRFAYGPRGKPSLSEDRARSGDSSADLRFNVSHSEDVALVAVCRGREIGVDVEFMREHCDLEGIAERFFSPGESRDLQSLPPSSRREAFFACWTRKEALIKAQGGGLFVSLRDFEVTLLPGEEAALRRVEWDPAETARWHLANLAMADGYAAALAVEGHDWNLDLRRWQDRP